ncbi:hypothetical protein CSCA_3433 [Clostridium scatologenes]|uniref:Uncharacterized protein n=1 Tax=Clostridium scatologenes TaxID=1548 RepID=A0A0E3K274_CLOSL|nr:hypothetical protein CSCA_3433 [Clostridium scatologenes]
MDMDKLHLKNILTHNIKKNKMNLNSNSIKFIRGEKYNEGY